MGGWREECWVLSRVKGGKGRGCPGCRTEPGGKKMGCAGHRAGAKGGQQNRGGCSLMTLKGAPPE